jgi:phosphatidylserine/phosphatidylglycerophosphate/cardiolipin synthase-like enzyme
VLVLKVINSAENSIRLAAYSFTSPSVVKALLAAKKRGVDVRVVVDEKGNKGKASIAALNLLVNADIPTRTIATYAIHHDKYIVSDDKHLQNGSFNYSQAAAKSNSENVLVVWNNPELAASFLKHWQSRWEQGVDYKSTY